MMVIILHENIILHYFSIHKVLYACKMDKPSDAAHVETVKKLCTKDKCDIDPKAVFGDIECPVPGEICANLYMLTICNHVL